MNNSMIMAEYFPTIPRDEIAHACKKELPLSDISALGSGFAVVAAAIADAAMNAPASEGLYRCVFPEGVTGHLAAFNDGSGLLGTIINNGNFVGQARWLPADAGAVPLAVDPVSLAIAVAMVSINKKLDDVKEMQQEIIAFLHEDKESQMEGLVNSLSDIMENYRYNSDNQIWISSHMTTVSSAKVAAEQNIIFYRKQVSGALGKKDWMHSSMKVNKLNKQLQHDFKYYQMCVYIFAYASFLEVLLGGNYRKSYLDHVTEKISEYSFQYRQDYSICYDHLEYYSKTSVQAKVLEGIEKAGKFAGNTIASIPVLSKGPVDEALIAAGDKLGQYNASASNKVMGQFRNNRDAGIQLFQDSIATINQMSNQPVEILFDKNSLYICA